MEDDSVESYLIAPFPRRFTSTHFAEVDADASREGIHGKADVAQVSRLVACKSPRATVSARIFFHYRQLYDLIGLKLIGSL